MAKKLISIRVSDRTARQIEELKVIMGDTQTGVISIAIDRMRRQEMKMFHIDTDKLTDVIDAFNEQVDPAATDADITNTITADWNEGAEHQQWIDSANYQEIVNWLSSFYK